MEKTEGLDRLFRPSSLAMVGASHDDQKGGGLLLKGLIKNRFQGKLYPINPGEAEIMGLKCYPSVSAVPGEIDGVVIAVPARRVPRLIAECGQKGVRFAVVHSVGFAEMGSAGKELENEMVRVARQYGIRIVGPNCMGIYCPAVGLNTVSPLTFLEDAVGTVAFVGQSGWSTGNIVRIGYERGLGFSKVVSIGNQADITIEDFIRYFADDNETQVIACYVEGIKRGREFFQLLKRTSLKKPVIVWKGGKTTAGVRAAASHTGSLAGNSAVFEAAVWQGGGVSAQNMEELVDLLVGFMCPVLPQGNRLGILVEAAGGAVASADILGQLGFELPALSAATQQALVAAFKDMLPASASQQNPVDLVWVPFDIGARIFLQASRLMLRDIDALLILTYAPLDEYFVSGLASLRDEAGKPIIVISGWPTEQRPGMRQLVKHGIPAFSIPERGLKVLAAMVRYRRYLAARPSVEG